MSDPLVKRNKKLKTLRYLKQPTEEQASELCKAFSWVLWHVYPNYKWEVGMNQTVVYIKNATLSTKHAFTIGLDEIDIDGKVLMRIGGEILERFGVSRIKGTRSEVDFLKRDVVGNCIPEM